MSPVIRVIVADDQAVVREGLAALLELTEDITVTGSAAHGGEVLELLDRVACDVVLMDLRMPVLDGIAATARITTEHPDVAVLVLTTYADRESVTSALAAGARGYLTKDSGRAAIAAAIRSATSGQSTFDAAVSRRLVSALAADPPTRAADPTQDGLTAREQQVLGYIGDGLANAEIAALLVVAPATVKTHINNAFAKIGATTRTEAARYAFRAGLSTP
jgi:DNA-binding NarL/FixJ family response regulator